MDTNNSSLEKNSMDNLNDFWKKLDPEIQKIVICKERTVEEEKQIDLFLEGLLKRTRENKVTIYLSTKHEGLYFGANAEGKCALKRKDAHNFCSHEWTEKDISKAVGPGCLYRDILFLIATLSMEGQVEIEVYSD